MLAPSGSAASPHRIKTALEIDRDLPIEQRIVAVGDLCKLHDAALLTSTSIPPNGRSAPRGAAALAEQLITTVKPSPASRSATAAPMPREAPVTIATLMLSWVMFNLLSFIAGHPLWMTKRWTFSLSG